MCSLHRAISREKNKKCTCKSGHCIFVFVRSFHGTSITSTTTTQSPLALNSFAVELVVVVTSRLPFFLALLSHTYFPAQSLRLQS